MTIVQTARRELARCHQPTLISELSAMAEALGKNPALESVTALTRRAEGDLRGPGPLIPPDAKTHAADDAQELRGEAPRPWRSAALSKFSS